MTRNSRENNLITWSVRGIIHKEMELEKKLKEMKIDMAVITKIYAGNY
jgi:hypothetical protein